jgi:DNA-directed RNA polymerase specialized sigma24 family protein
MRSLPANSIDFILTDPPFSFVSRSREPFDPKRQHVDASAQEPPDDRREIATWEKSLEGVWGRKTAAEIRSLLSADQLRTIEQHFFEGYTLEEIAERMNQSLVNVRHHHYRGLEKLLGMIRRHPQIREQQWLSARLPREARSTRF